MNSDDALSRGPAFSVSSRTNFYFQYIVIVYGPHYMWIVDVAVVDATQFSMFDIYLLVISVCSNGVLKAPVAMFGVMLRLLVDAHH